MTRRLTDTQEDFAAAIRDFGEREREGWRRAVEHDDLSHDPQVQRKLADIGWLGVGIPERYGGAGGDPVDVCLLIECGMRHQIPLLNVASTFVVARIFHTFGSEAQKDSVLRELAGGAVAAIAMSEPSAGSDVSALAARATRDEAGFVINGQKTWISNAHLADGILAVVRTSSTPGQHAGMTMLWVPIDTPGLTVQGIDTLAGREVNDVYFDDCRVPATAVVGEVDAGWSQVMACLNFERLIVAAAVLGIGEAAFDSALSYVKQREQFGRPIGSFQALGHRLADHATELECCRLLVYDVAHDLAVRDDLSVARRASMAKLKVSVSAKAVAIDGMQMMGGHGYALETTMPHLVRLVLASTIYGGTSEIQRQIIAKSYGL